MNNGALYMSINPNATNKIANLIKTYEFRNYFPKNEFKFLYVYVTSPICELKYILEIGNIVKYPNKIIENGDGNKDFNNGKKANYAYEIIKVNRLKNSVNLKTLKEKFKFTPPQAYAYDKKYPDLTEYIKQLPTEEINYEPRNEIKRRII
jgi:predicted transcriptional regulator